MPGLYICTHALTRRTCELHRATVRWSGILVHYNEIQAVFQYVLHLRFGKCCCCAVTRVFVVAIDLSFHLSCSGLWVSFQDTRKPGTTVCAYMVRTSGPLCTRTYPCTYVLVPNVLHLVVRTAARGASILCMRAEPNLRRTSTAVCFYPLQ